MEQTLNLDQDNEIISLLNPHDLIRYRNKYKFLHVGLVQVAFIPLTLLGLNACMQATLKMLEVLIGVHPLCGP